MSDTPRCTTHHHACDCREYRFREMEAELTALKHDHDRLQDRCTELVNKKDGLIEALLLVGRFVELAEQVVDEEIILSHLIRSGAK